MLRPVPKGFGIAKPTKPSDRFAQMLLWALDPSLPAAGAVSAKARFLIQVLSAATNRISLSGFETKEFPLPAGPNSSPP
jgi:hypothetical protein